MEKSDTESGDTLCFPRMASHVLPDAKGVSSDREVEDTDKYRNKEEVIEEPRQKLYQYDDPTVCRFNAYEWHWNQPQVDYSAYLQLVQTQNEYHRYYRYYQMRESVIRESNLRVALNKVIE